MANSSMRLRREKCREMQEKLLDIVFPFELAGRSSRYGVSICGII